MTKGEERGVFPEKKTGPEWVEFESVKRTGSFTSNPCVQTMPWSDGITCDVRNEAYQLVFVDEVGCSAIHIHLMLPSVQIVQDADGNYAEVTSLVPTGFTPPNGMDQPFLHLMFENIRATEKTRVGAWPSGSVADRCIDHRGLSLVLLKQGGLSVLPASQQPQHLQR